MVLREKLKAIKMAKTDSATAYLEKITSVKDELAIVRETIAPTKLVKIAIAPTELVFPRLGRFLWIAMLHVRTFSYGRG